MQYVLFLPGGARAFVIAVGFLLSWSFTGQAQIFDPFQGKSSDYQVKLTRYFKTPEQEKATRPGLLDSIRAFQQDTSWTPANLKARLDLFQHLGSRLRRHQFYRRLAVFGNNQDASAKADYRQLSAALNQLSASYGQGMGKPGIVGIPDSKFSELGLTPYAFLLRRTKSQAAHRLPPHDQAIVDKLMNPLEETLTDRYSHLVDKLKAEIGPAPSKAPLSGTQNSPVSSKKATAAAQGKYTKALLHAYTKHEEILATTLIDITKINTAKSVQYAYPNTPSLAYDVRLQLTEPQIKELLDELSSRAGLLKEYQRMQAQQLQRTAKLDTVHSWDLSMALEYSPAPQTFPAARKNVLQALQPLGKEYVGAFAALLEPKNGVMDITGGPNRVTEYTALGYPRVPTTLYMKDFSGEFTAVKVLIHEGGHAIHRQLMNDNRIVPAYGNGPNFLFEGFALFNEFLLLDELGSKSKTKGAKAYYTKQFCDKLAYELFVSAQEGAFEQKLYDGVAAGKIKDAGDIDSVYAGIMNQYDVFFKDEPERRTEWAGKRLFYIDPLYYINYLYATLVAAKLYEQAHQHPKRFATQYTALLKNGFDASAEELLRKHMGFDLNRKDLLDGALQLMTTKTEELNRLHQ